MRNQESYYNNFGTLFEQSILDCPEPEYWTTDYDSKGRIYLEMRQRVDRQKNLVLSAFATGKKVLDIGCGFGRQAVFLAKSGFTVAGTDTSKVFIEIANKLFDKHGYKGEFYCANILSDHFTEEKFSQVILFDVLEHIKKPGRRKFLKAIYELADKRATLLISLPRVKDRLSSKMNNRLRRAITQHFSYFLNREEHPYPIPGKKDIVRLANPFFDLAEYSTSPDTEFYIFKKRVDNTAG